MSDIELDNVALTDGSEQRRSYAGAAKSRTLIGSIVIIITACLVLAVIFVSMKYDAPDDTEKVVYYRGGSVSTTNSYATDAGIQVLKDGGNAVDAAATIQFVLNVVQPQSTGIGGGLLALLYNGTTSDLVALDGREEAPKAYTSNAFCADRPQPGEGQPCVSGAIPFYPQRCTGGHSVGVPGTLAATARALREHGTYSLAQALAPAIKLARDGFKMYEHLHTQLTRNVPRLKMFPASAKLWLNADETGPRVGIDETFTNPDLAATFELIAAKGIDVLYGGEVGTDLVNAVRAAYNPDTNLTGLMTMEDLVGYRAVKRQSVSVKFRDYTVHGVPPPGSGAVIGQVLRILEDTGAPKNILSKEHIGRLINAQDIAFADRNMYLADTDFTDVPLAGMISDGYMKERAALSVPGKATPIPVPAGVPPGAPKTNGLPPLEVKSGTTHFSIMDTEKNVVSWTTTIEENLGSAVTVPGRGFLLNNELTDFTGLARDPATNRLYANRPEGGKKLRRTALGSDANTMGGKRPRSSMSPTLITLNDGTPYMALGSPGGSKIPGNVLNVLVHFVDNKVSLAEATNLPRVISRNTDLGSLLDERLYNNQSLRTGLEGQGFKIRGSDIDPETGHQRPLGYVQSVVLDSEGFQCAADSTRMPRATCGGVDPVE